MGNLVTALPVSASVWVASFGGGAVHLCELFVPGQAVAGLRSTPDLGGSLDEQPQGSEPRQSIEASTTQTLAHGASSRGHDQ